MNDVIHELWELKPAVVGGIVIYAVFLSAMYALKKRKGISWRYLAELAFCVYVASLLKLAGVFSMQYSLVGIKNYNFVPFIGSAFVPVLLSFLLFLPHGFLLPFVFSSQKWTWKKALYIGAATSLCIEVLQLFGGRYSEIDDVLMNTLGALSGYWGKSGYQFCVDYAKLDTDLKEHEADILAQYQVLQEMIVQSL